MPANLNPEYFVAEKKYKEAKTREEKISALQEMLSVMPKHKGTDHLQGDIKRRISALKEEAEKKRSGGPKRQASPYVIPRAGAGQVAVIGPPNTGKSALVGVLSNAPVKVGDYPFTTAVPLPGMLEFDRIKIQLVDTPPVSEGNCDPELADLLRRADLALVVLKTDDPEILDQLPMLQRQLDHHHLSLVEDPEAQTEVVSVGGGVKTILVVTGGDLDDANEIISLLEESLATKLPISVVSTTTEAGLSELGWAVWRALKMIRVYSKQPGKKADLKEPFFLPIGGSVMDLARKIHKEVADSLKFARVWGENVHDGQSVQREHALSDGDIVEIHT